MKVFLLYSFGIISGIYILICTLLYFFQENLIFYPTKLDSNYRFNFSNKFEELTFKVNDGETLNGLLFTCDKPRGLIFYLHGNAGALNSWGAVANIYTNLDYDVFMLDYRGYGKSSGTIEGESQLFEDNQIVYDELKKRYDEDQIIVLGYSIGSGFASKLASTNHPRMLILQAPYYSLSDLMGNIFPIVPKFILKYNLENNSHLKDCKMPVVIFHGENDEVIYFGSSLKLKAEFKEGDMFFPLAGVGHNGMSDSDEYRRVIKKLLVQ